MILKKITKVQENVIFFLWDFSMFLKKTRPAFHENEWLEQ